MAARKASRGSASKTNSPTHVSQELNICLESGETYRPFVDPKRIEKMDSRKLATCDARAQTKGVPDSYLGVMTFSDEISPSTQKPHEYPSRSRSRELPPFDASSSATHLDTLLAEPEFSSDTRMSSSSTPTYPIEGMFDGSVYPFEWSIPEEHGHELPYSSACSPLSPWGEEDMHMINFLEDPSFVANAHETVQKMHLGDMDLSLIHPHVGYSENCVDGVLDLETWQLSQGNTQHVYQY